MQDIVRQLVVIDGPDKGRSFLVNSSEPLPIGRGVGTATRLSDLRVSRTHCTVRLDGERVVLNDCNSAVGTFVNNNRVSEQVLHPGDIIRIGDTELKYIEEGIAEAETVAGDLAMLFASPGGGVKPPVAANQVLREPVRPPTPIPTPPPESDPPTPEGFIAVQCKCGQRLQAREQYAGSRVRCPACRNFVILPGQPPHGETTGNLPYTPSSAYPPKPAQKKSLSVVDWALGAAVLVAVLLGVAYFSGALGNKGKSSGVPAVEKKGP
jgi:hypothetical protein